ncbi:uncharacterized protein LOC104441082 [Eucalyptus grandis]|uniref:uncharacterized protein LOC104441082 n=1 Tax=Eucalyptus grandis TaxID=71139 RepID=UPI00192ECC6E|nr:uncharacterized protein LOC104441082 [Eucalyptus grandis]
MLQLKIPSIFLAFSTRSIMESGGGLHSEQAVLQFAFEQEMKLLRNEKNKGYSSLFDQLLNPANQINTGGWIAALRKGRMEVPENDPNVQKPHFGPNPGLLRCCIFTKYIVEVVEADAGGISWSGMLSFCHG